MIKYVEPLELDLDVAQGGHENRESWMAISIYVPKGIVCPNSDTSYVARPLEVGEMQTFV